MGQRRFILSVLSLGFVLCQTTHAQELPGKYVWPIKGNTNLSAGFCDFRTRHHHGGIDISTDGKEGLEVRAADSGWVGRVVVGYWGYGKAIYLQMSDGRMAVYGHLSELSPKIKSYVEDEQYRSQRYEQNLFPTKRQIPIARGEVIARSGQTGVGPPHLHFEIRSGNNQPLNPLAFFTKPDGIKPSIHSVTITPIQPDDLDTPPSTVDGSLLPKTYLVQKSGLATSPHITGSVGISVLADDHIDAPRWTMSAFSHRLAVNGDVIGEVRYDSINFEDTRQIEVERQYDPDGGLSPRAVNLFRYDNNTLWNYHGFARDGILSKPTSLKSGRNPVRIEVEDFAGNRSAVEFSLVLDTIPSRGELASSSPAVGGVLAWGGAVLSLASEQSKSPDIAIDPEGAHPITLWIRSTGGWQAWLPATTGADVLWVKGRSGSSRSPAPLGWKAIKRHDGGMLTSEDGKATVSFAAGDIYESGDYTLKQAGAGDKSSALTPVYTLAPRYIPFARDLKLNISMPTTKIPQEKLAIYRRAGRGWSFEGAKHEDDWAALGATIKSAGSFAILADQKPPVITNLTPAKGAVVRDSRPMIRFSMSDNLAGIGSDKDMQMTIDDKWVPVEFDPDLAQAKAQPRWQLDPGEHHVVITVRDACGNEVRSERTLIIKR